MKSLFHGNIMCSVYRVPVRKTEYACLPTRRDDIIRKTVGKTGFGGLVRLRLRSARILDSATRPLTLASEIHRSTRSSSYSSARAHFKSANRHHIIMLVGKAGFEPATSWSRTKRAIPSCATSRTPLLIIVLIINVILIIILV